MLVEISLVVGILFCWEFFCLEGMYVTIDIENQYIYTKNKNASIFDCILLKHMLTKNCIMKYCVIM